MHDSPVPNLLMIKGIACLALLLLALAPLALANDQVRHVQEELRKRNLYFGDIDGNNSEDLVLALKRYQARKGFSVSGQINEETATSLNIASTPDSRSVASASLPNIPILKSDIARDLPQAQRVALEQQAETNPDLVPTPAPPAESPPPSQDLRPERIQQFVEEYLRDAESDDVAAQTRYFAYPVDYFVHGEKGPDFIRKDVKRYLTNWPEREYKLIEPPKFMASGRDGETIVEFPLSYRVRKGPRSASGMTKNTWTIRPEGEELKIIGISEEHLRPNKG